MRYREPRLRKRGKRYQLDYVNPEGGRRQLSAGHSYKGAEQMRLKFANWLLEGKDPEREMERTQQIEEQRSITLREFFPIFLERHGKNQGRSQQRNYRIFMANLERCPQISKVPIGEIRKPLLLDYMRARTDQDGISPSTANHEAKFVRNMLNRAVEWEILDRNPLEGIRLLKESGKRDVDITIHQLQALVDELKSPLSEIVEFSAWSGMRKENVLNLRIEQIIFNDLNGTALIIAKLKGGEIEETPIGPEAVKVLRSMISDRTEGYVFPNKRTGKSYVSPHKTIDRVIRRLGLTARNGSKLRFHDLRHFRASWLRNVANMSLEDIQAVLGHRNKSTTEKYVSVDKRAVGERLSVVEKPRQ